jgi:succinyl-diaminopimelate desuccinylase
MFLTTALLATTLTTKVLAHYDKHESKRLVPMLSEVIRFPTYENNTEAHAAQKAWLLKTAKELGFVARDAGKITEIELAGPAGAPVLGLVIHGDVQPVDADSWSFAPFGGEVKDGYVLGRGAADDKGPLVQALLTMKALKESGAKRTHTIRLLVGSEEESAAGEIAEYLKTHKPPDYSLVLDAVFPAVVGEKAWDGIAIAAASLADRGDSELPYTVASLDAGLSPSIVPDRAELKLRWKPGKPLNWDKTIAELTALPMPEGTRLVAGPGADPDVLRVVVYGKSAHSGMNITGGRNALVALARVMEGRLPRGGADDLLALARVAGQDLYGSGLGITSNDPIWGRYAVNVATVKPSKNDGTKTVLFINLRRTPPRDAKQSKAHLEQFFRDFNTRTGASLTVIDDESYFEDEPLVFDPNAKFIRRLMNVYSRATGEKTQPAIAGGGTYAKRLPNSIAFGMWFPDKPYPGHDLDEKNPIDDLQRGARVLIHALTDLATGAKIEEPFKP